MPESKVLCVGFHKTGTSSLGAALEMLGYRVAGPFGVRDPRIAETALDQAVARLERHDAAQDNPWPLLYPELDRRFPGTRFVLTLRPEQAWLASTVAHFGGVSSPMREWIYGPGAGDPVGHEDRYLARYRRHNDEVTAYFADRPDDLLVMRLDRGDGWERLCPVLGAEVPDAPFPHANRGSGARRAVNRLRGRLRGLVRR